MILCMGPSKVGWTGVTMNIFQCCLFLIWYLKYLVLN